MFANTKCECGHQNPVGTVLCEACGKPQTEDDALLPLEMRYDGAARRSQKANPSILDKVWNFFSSVKIAIYIIAITLVASAIGTIYPQENTFLDMDPSTFYKTTYGTLGEIYYVLGLSHTFSSWWFITLLFMIGTSLVVCSLDRVLPLYRALSKQQLRKHPQFLTRQRVTYSGDLLAEGGANQAASATTVSLSKDDAPAASPAPNGAAALTEAEWMASAAAFLRKKHYRVYTEDSAMLAEKYRFSRWGPYINHIGLIIFLLGVLMRSIPGWHMDQYIGFPEGSIKQIPDTSYYLQNEKFTVELYNENELSDEFRQKGQVVPKTYETKAVLYHCTADCDDPTKQPVLEKVHEADIFVNKPLDYKGLKAYQFDFKQSPLLISVKPTLKNKTTGEAYGSFELPMNNPQDQYTVGPYTLKLKGYFPEFGLDDKGQPSSLSNEPKAPAFIFNISGPGLAANGEPYLYFPRQVDKETFRQDEINGAIGQKLDLSVGSMEGVKFSTYTSYLNIRVDKAMPYIWVGAAISMIGLIMGFYWQHRRIWLRIDAGRLTLGAHTNKNWFGLRNETAGMLAKTGIHVSPKSLEQGGKPA